MVHKWYEISPKWYESGIKVVTKPIPKVYHSGSKFVPKWYQRETKVVNREKANFFERKRVTGTSKGGIF